MTCHNCRIECKRNGKNRKGEQRYACQQCHKRFTEPREDPLDGMYLPMDQAETILRLLVEGNSISSIERITDVHHSTILKLLVLAGARCERLLEDKIQGIDVTDVQADELWSFIQKKEGHKWPWEANDAEIGDSYCFIAIERNFKLILAWHMGRRTKADTEEFTGKLRRATSEKTFQLTTDGFKPYVAAVKADLGDKVDFAQLIKVYTQDPEGQRRYSPPDVTSAEKVPVFGNPDPAKICTSHVERQNLTIRMGNRRYTRLTNAFSKKWINHKAMQALHIAYYNLCRKHQTIKMTPAMAAGIADHIWSVRELLDAA
jgi:transposase-like protein/IS1 family transposase